jgi:hypothetical protein
VAVDGRVSRIYLGSRAATGVVDNSGFNPFGNGLWCATFDPHIFAVSTGEFEIYHLALKGPNGSRVQWFVDRTFYDITNHGDVNSWDPNEPCHLLGGESVYFYWETAATPTPSVTVWLRQPPIL